jgi:hypothetical protein
LTIFHDGEEHEKIELSELKQRDDMHAMFLEKGFELKSEEEIKAMLQQRKKDIQDEQDLKEAKKLEKEEAAYEKRTARKIQELEVERDGTNDPTKKRKLAAAMEEKSQHLQLQREQTRKKTEEINKRLHPKPDRSEL